MENFVESINIGGPKSKYSIEHLTPMDTDIKEMISAIDIEVTKHCLWLYNSNVPTEETLNKMLIKWAKAKYPIYVLLGRKLSVNFTYQIPFVKSSIVDELVGVCKKTEIIREKNNEKVKIDTCHFRYYIPIIKLFSDEDYVKNVCPNNDDIKALIDKYVPGMKLSKFFSRFFEDEQFDIELSKIFQKNKGSSDVTVSIDFNDFLTASINENNWTTCFSPGGVHPGSISDITFDQVTMTVFYSSKNMKCGKSSWNSKALRSFVHVDKKTSAFVISRAYPNTDNEEFYRAIKFGVENIISKYFNEELTWNVCCVTPKMDKGDCYGEYGISDDNLRRVHRNKNLQFVDSNSPQYFLDPIKYLCSPEKYIGGKIVIGLESPICMNCGKEIEGSLYNRLMCGECASDE